MMIPNWMNPGVVNPGNMRPNVGAMFPPGQMIVGRWVRDYRDVQNAPMLADGSTTIYMLTDEPVLYLAGLNEQGRPVVSGFRITPLNDNIQTAPEKQQTPPKQQVLTMDERMAKIESVLPDIMEIIQQIKPLLSEGVTNNESNS